MVSFCFLLLTSLVTRRVDASESCWVMLLMLLSIYLNVPFVVVFLPLIYQLSIKKMHCALAYVLFFLYLCSQL